MVEVDLLTGEELSAMKAASKTSRVRPCWTTYAAIDRSRKEVILNLSLIADLVDRAEAGRLLLEDANAYYYTMSYLYDINPLQFALED